MRARSSVGEKERALALEPMARGDVRAVAALERRTFSHPWSEDLFRRELRLPQSKITVARSADGTIVGYICRWLTHDVVEIQNVAVHPDWRRRAVARRLVECVLAEARGVGVRRAVLEVRCHNHPAIRLYQSLGFVETGARRRYYADGEDALLMERIEPAAGPRRSEERRSGAAPANLERSSRE